MGWRDLCWGIGGMWCPNMVTGEKDTGEVEIDVVWDEVVEGTMVE